MRLISWTLRSGSEHFQQTGGKKKSVKSIKSVKISDNFCAMGHCAGSGYSLWAVAKDLVSAVGHGSAFRSALWAIAQNYTAVFKSLPYPLKGQ
jgi:hypothetical protein